MGPSAAAATRRYGLSSAGHRAVRPRAPLIHLLLRPRAEVRHRLPELERAEVRRLAPESVVEARQDDALVNRGAVVLQPRRPLWPPAARARRTPGVMLRGLRS